MTEAYSSTAGHLQDELDRLDQLLRARVVAWRMTTAATKPPDLWGMLHASDEEVERFLQAPFFGPRDAHPDVVSATAPYLDRAAEQAEAIAARLHATPSGASRLDRLSSTFSLSRIDLDILLLAALSDLDQRYRRIAGYLQDDLSRHGISVNLLEELLEPNPVLLGSVRSALEPRRPLAEHALVVAADELRGTSTSDATVRVDDRIVGYLLGGDAPDRRVARVLTDPPAGVAWDDLVLDPDQAARLRGTAAWLAERHQAGSAGAVLYLNGPEGSGRSAVAAAVCNDVGLPLIVASVGRALQSPLGWEDTVRLVMREARLRDAAVLWRGCEQLFEQGQPPLRWEQLVESAERFPGLVFFAGDAPWDASGHFRTKPFLRIDFRALTHALRVELWERLLPHPDAMAVGAPPRHELAEQLAIGFQLTPGQAVDALSTARSLAVQRDPQDPRPAADDLYEGCRRQSSRMLTAFTRRIEPRPGITFDDLILPPASLRQLAELRDRLRYRARVYDDLGFEQRLPLGKGFVVLFTGSSGTGKTMAAELLAREQGVDLYKVDLAALVSKWVGETEKNLARVFREAEDANAIIFFDECDALFGKRGEVKEARDRWANLEVNYLLQRIEEYAGVVILASNLRQNIDEAFTRRLQQLVEFPAPNAAARAEIWRRLLPDGIEGPSDDDIDELAERFNLSGGNLKNAVVDAAFRAVAENPDAEPRLETRHLVAGIAREYQKLGKPITKGEFGEEFYGLLEDGLMEPVR